MNSAENDLYQEVVLEHKRAPRNLRASRDKASFDS